MRLLVCVLKPLRSLYRKWQKLIFFSRLDIPESVRNRESMWERVVVRLFLTKVRLTLM